MIEMSRLILLLTVLLCACVPGIAGDFKITDDHTIVFDGKHHIPNYLPEFTVIYTPKNSFMKMRPAGLHKVSYNVATWHSEQADMKRTKRDIAQQGDGFDDHILAGSVEHRTANIFRVGEQTVLRPTGHSIEADGCVVFTYEEQERYLLRAELLWDKTSDRPLLTYYLTAKEKGWYSVGYTGFVGRDLAQVEQLWQPLIWQERRLPDQSYLTLAYRCPVPSAFVTVDQQTYGVVAHPSEFPFDPLPTPKNSRFGVAVRNGEGAVEPMLFAPVPGGHEGLFTAGKTHSFTAVLYGGKGDTTDALREVAETLYGFDYNRHNALGTMNETIERMIDYVMSPYSRFLDEEKGCTYSTDVPGAVKNVSTLNPLEIALLNDNEAMLLKRAKPIYEYVLSREKLLFCVDSTQRIQHPSRRLNGPCCPLSELTTLNTVLNDNAHYLLSMAEKEFGATRVRNLDVVEKGGSWRNAMHLYRATGDSQYLERAKRGADNYLKNRVERPATDFKDPEAGGFFFWTGFAPKWIDLLCLYELTGEKRYLQAAHQGAKFYTQYVWYAPMVPDTEILVHPDGKVPHYGYLRSKGHPQMEAAPEKAPAWRLSEIGLTAESSGTSTGHRGIFMTNYAAWMLRLAHYTGDEFLARTANHAVVGRYRNFPGYHINTARTTIYEKADYPLREHKELSANSFHYNHIMPHVSLLYDFLITQALYRSHGSVDFPGEFIEGYAYLQSKFYGHRAGTIYGEEASLWMPSGLVKPTDSRLNYIAAVGKKGLYLVLMNQSAETVATTLTLDYGRTHHQMGKSYRVEVLGGKRTTTALMDGVCSVEVAPEGITTLRIETDEPIRPELASLLTADNRWSIPYVASADDVVRCMQVPFGAEGGEVFVYLTQDDTRLKKVWFELNGERVEDAVYPFEHSAPLRGEQVNIVVKALTLRGEEVQWESLQLKK